jgi:hypothetical protein
VRFGIVAGSGLLLDEFEEGEVYRNLSVDAFHFAAKRAHVRAIQQILNGLGERGMLGLPQILATLRYGQLSRQKFTSWLTSYATMLLKPALVNTFPEPAQIHAQIFTGVNLFFSIHSFYNLT